MLNDFYFLVFSPNPAKNLVRVFIDDGTIRLWTNIDKFIKIIKLVMSDEIAQAVKSACTTYGCFFMIDRCENDIRKLNIKSEDNVINIKQLHNDIERAKKEGEKDIALRERFLAAVQTPVNERLSRQTKGNYLSGNKFSSSIIYGSNQNYGSYRPY